MAKIRVPKLLVAEQAEQGEQVQGEQPQTEKPSEQVALTPSEQVGVMLDSVPGPATKLSTHGEIVPVPDYEGLGMCSLCGAAEAELDEFTCDEYKAKVAADREREPAMPNPIGPCTYCGKPDHWRPDCPRIAAEQRHRQELQEAKDDYIEASIARREIERDLKAAKDRQKDALTFYEELKARGPVIPKPVEPQAGTSASGGVVASGPDGWRAIPITDLALDTIKGLGAKKKGKKYQALVDAIPTLGALEDRRVAGGADGLRSQMPDGVGEVVAEPLEELHLNYIAKWNANRSSGAESGGDGSTVPEQSDVAASPNVEAHSAPDRTSETPSATEWELWPDEKRHDWLQERATQISESMLIGDELQRPSDKLTAAFQSGELAYGRGEVVADCPYLPGSELDDWLTGYFVAARLEESRELDAVAEHVADGMNAELAGEQEPEQAQEPEFALAANLDDI